MAAVALINGVNYSWADIKLVLFGVPVIGITKISYKNKQTKTNNYGYGNQPVSRGYGQIEPEGSIDIYQDELRRIIAAAPNRDPLQIGMFDIPVIFGNSIANTSRDILRACEFTEEGVEAAQNDTKLIVSLPLIIGRIEHL
ncbi:hypothetical protein ACTJJB_01560 [Chitinophaga sp. 22536]|uniref:hypothetical protein n=1 Tax=unclassified Chitinophaga TaxID=2619133 RepID=UPI003F830DF3